MERRKRKPWVTSDADAAAAAVVVVAAAAAAVHLHATVRSPHARFLFLRATVFRDD